MAQSEKNFRDLLCEGRAQPPETSDPAAARTIDELRKQVTKLRGELESERQKVKEEEWEHEKELKRLREELEKKLDVTVEALAVRKDQEKQTDLKKFEERLRRQMDMERKTQEREKAEEVRRVQRRLERERNDSIRHAVEDERRTALEEMQKMMPEDECAMREAKLAREVFLLGEQNEQLQEAVRNLSGENRSQIDLIRRMKQEHEAEITSLIKQCHMDASRDMAQIRLAERLIAEKEADIQAVGYRADVAMLEKEALAEELVTMKSVLSVGSSSAMEPTSSPTMTRRSIGGPGGLLQRRVEDLEVIARKLEDERQELKQENASLRKKLVHEGESLAGKMAGGDDKLKKLRKRNADLVALAKQLDEKYKALKVENEQMHKQSVSGGDVEQQVRKSLSRQHARDIMDYTKQIHGKDRELEVLRRKLTKYEISGPAPRREAAPASLELEKQVKAMAMERLRMEKHIAKLYTNIPGDIEVENISRKEVQAELEKTVQLEEENKTLRKQLAEAQQPTAGSKQDEVDYQPASGTSKAVSMVKGEGSPSLPRQGSMEQAVGRVEALKQENNELAAQRDSLAARVETLEKFESECSSLQASVKDLQTARSEAEHRLRSVSQQLQQAKLAVEEMEQVQEHSGDVEREVTEVRGQLNEKDTEIRQLELECQKATSSLEKGEKEADMLRRSVIDLESIISEKEKECGQLRSSFEKLQLQSLPPRTMDVGQQVTPCHADVGQQATPCLVNVGQQASPCQTDVGQQTSPPQTVRHLGSQQPPTTSSNQAVRHQLDSEQRVKPDSTVSTTTATVMAAATTTSTTPTSKFSRDRVKSPVHRDIARLRMNSPKASTGDLSLEFEMNAAGFEVTDSYDSSECVGFMSDDANLDDTLHEEDSNLSLETVGSERLEEPASLDKDLTLKANMRMEEETERHRVPGDRGKGKDEGREEEGRKKEEPLKIAEKLEEVSGAIVEKPQPFKEEGVRRGEGRGKEEESSPVQPGEQAVAPATRPPGEGGVGGVTEEGQQRGEKEEGGAGKRMSLEELAMEDSSDSDVASSESSEGDLPGLKKKSPKASEKAEPGGLVPSGVMTEPPRLETEERGRQPLEMGGDGESPVSVFIAKFTYSPSEMSPNPNFEQELAVNAGDYLYVLGDMDEDGFYHGQLLSGESGLVPSNFIERVLDEGEGSPHLHKKGLLGRRLSNLQDIAEEDEENSTGSSIFPPQNVELERQFVEGSGYSVVIQWAPPEPLPPEATGYNVYVNGEFRMNVEGANQKNVMLSAIPRQQLVKISVRTVTEQGESPDPKLVILNPHYPESPTDVKIQRAGPPRAIVVDWVPSPPVDGGLSISGYAIYINNHRVVQLAANDAPMERVNAQLLAEDLKHLKHIHQEVVSLTVRAIADRYESVNSNAALVSKELVSFLLDGTASSMEDSRSSSALNASEEREIYSQAKMEVEGHVTAERNDGSHVTNVGSHVTADGSHVTNNGHHLSNDATDGTDGERVNGHVTKSSVDCLYYRALYSYDPFYNSPNDGGTDEELAFQDGDIIMRKGEVDEDGFFEGDLNGRVGLVPSNMVELIADTEELAKIHELLQAQKESTVSPTINGQTSPFLEDIVARRMKASYDYVPSTDSPNDNVEEELTFREGDILLVYGRKDEDGFYQAELKGKRGIVPSTFLEELVSPEQTPERELFTASQEEMRTADQTLQSAADSARKSRPSSTRGHSPQSKSILSRGRDVLTKSLPMGKRRDSK